MPERALVTPNPKVRFSEFWQRAGTHLAINLRFVWPLFAFMLLFALTSAGALFSVDNAANSRVHTYWDALYFTWATMTTIGTASSDSAWGRIITSVDSLMGLITIGATVWLVTWSLSPAAPSSDPKKE